MSGYHTGTKQVLDRQKFYQSDTGIRKHPCTDNAWEEYYKFGPNQPNYGRNGSARHAEKRFPPKFASKRKQPPYHLDIKLRNLKKESLTPSVKKSDATGKVGNYIFSTDCANKYDQNWIAKRKTIPIVKLIHASRSVCSTSSTSGSFKSCGPPPDLAKRRAFSECLEIRPESSTKKVEIKKPIVTIRQKLIKLMAHHPNGIDVMELGHAYKLKYGEDFQPSVFDYSSIAEMCIIENGIFKSERSKSYPNSWTVFPVPVTEEPCNLTHSKTLQIKTTSNNPSLNKELNEMIRNASLLQDTAGGGSITKDKFLEIYFDTFRKPLNLQKLGMSTLDEFLEVLKDKDVIGVSSKFEDPFKGSSSCHQELVISTKKK